MRAALRKNIKGILITFEGIDYSGKSLQCGLFSQRLKEVGVSILSLRDPGATTISEKIRAILLDNDHSEMSPWTELLLYEAARAQMIEQTIKPALAEEKVVVCDRLYDSTTAYQGYGRRLDLILVNAANKIGACGVEPDLTILLDISAHEATKRKIRSQRQDDRMELQGEEFQERVRQGYLQIAAGAPERIQVIDSNQSVETISEIIWQIFINIWPDFAG